MGASVRMYSNHDLHVSLSMAKTKKNQKREKAAFISLSILGWSLAIFLIIFPDIPGPTQMIDWIYKPFGKLLEK